MAKLRVLPHRVAADDCVHWGSWWVRMGGKRLPVEDRLKGWDYASEVSFELQPTVDIEALVRTTGLEDVAAMHLVVLLDCRSTGNRFIERRRLDQLDEDDSNVLVVQPPLGSMAESILLSAHLVLDGFVPSGAADIATRPGSRLAWSTAHTVRLEGDAPRFPTEAVPFSSLALDAAPWTLQMRFSDMDESFLGAVRLLINTEHPAADLLLDDTQPESAVAQSVLRIDIARQMLLHVALDETTELAPGVDWPEGSVRAVLESMTDVFLGSDLTSTLNMARSDIVAFERRLQDRFDLLRGV